MTSFSTSLSQLALTCLLLAPLGATAQTAPAAAPADTTDSNSSDPQATKLMQEMLAALGGARWLAVHNVYEEGSAAGFFRGEPTGSLGLFRSWRTVPTTRTDPGLLRVVYTKKQDVASILLADEDWEITYRGKRLLSTQEYGSTFLRRDHSLDEAVRVWWHAPGTVLFFGGHKIVERRLIDEITLFDDHNDNITLQLDADTHLPARLSFVTRNPLYKDKDEEATDYSDYHDISGLPTSLRQTIYHNGDMVSQRYLTKVAYNVELPSDAFNVDATVAKLKR